MKSRDEALSEQAHRRGLRPQLFPTPVDAASTRLEKEKLHRHQKKPTPKETLVETIVADPSKWDPAWDALSEKQMMDLQHKLKGQPALQKALSEKLEHERSMGDKGFAVAQGYYLLMDGNSVVRLNPDILRPK